MANELNVPKVERVDEEVDAQVQGQPQPAPDKVREFTTAVRVDEPVLDPNAENAVLVEGQGGEGHDLESILPAHGFVDGETHEDIFAREGPDSDTDDE